ncbi:hypothetical protein Tco_0042046, partial [Tanacetum coccineum]
MFLWVDTPLRGLTKMSKLDRFLVSQGLLDLFPNLIGLILHRHISDHKPIILKESHVDYGPTPFRLFHSWFLEHDFNSVVEDSWNSAEITSSNAMIVLKNKLKILKQRLKTWSNEKRNINDHDRKILQESLLDIDLRLDKGESLPDDIYKRSNILHDISVMDRKSSIDLAQKAKVKW